MQNISPGKVGNVFGSDETVAIIEVATDV